MTDAEIAAIVERFPLPEGVDDVVLNKTEVAAFFQTSDVTVGKWIANGMPALKEGTNGSEWQFQASHCWAWRQSTIADEQHKTAAARAAIEAMRLHLIGGQAGDTLRGLPPKEREQIYAVEAAHQRLLRETNSTVPREEVQAALEDIFSLMRDAVSSLSDRLEREGGLSARDVAKVDEIGEQLLVELNGKIAEFFHARPVSNRRIAQDLFSS